MSYNGKTMLCLMLPMPMHNKVQGEQTEQGLIITCIENNVEEFAGKGLLSNQGPTVG